MVMWPYKRPCFTFCFYCFIAVAVIGIIILSVLVPKVPKPDKDTSPKPKPVYQYYPYHVSIQLDKKHHCSGSLISEKHVLTAAHCVDKLIIDRIPTSRIKVAVGTKKVPGGTIYDTDTFTRHDSYDPKIMKDDVAVIRLQQKVTESSDVGIIQLPDRGQMVYYGQKLDASEFNFEQLSESPRWDFNKITRYVVHNNTCQEHFYKQALSKKFCAVVYNGHNAERDGGSPATINKKYLIGIFSRESIRLTRIGVPDIFTHVASYLDYIEKEMARTD